MLPERLPKGHYLIKGNNVAIKVKRVKKHPEYSDERIYILEGYYGTEHGTYEVTEIAESGFTDCVSPEELNTLWREGKYLPPNGKCRVNKSVRVK